jgi:hypothetical protein
MVFFGTSAMNQSTRLLSSLPTSLSLVPVAVGCFAAIQLMAQTHPSPAPDSSAELSRAVGPFIQKNCQMCHNDNYPSGSVDLQQLLATPNSLAERHDTWENVAYQLRVGQMPPAGAPKPSKADADAALDLISRAVASTPRGSAPAASTKEEPPTTDWRTFSYDPERTGWDRAETTISKPPLQGCTSSGSFRPIPFLMPSIAIRRLPIRSWPTT